MALEHQDSFSQWLKQSAQECDREVDWDDDDPFHTNDTDNIHHRTAQNAYSNSGNSSNTKSHSPPDLTPVLSNAASSNFHTDSWGGAKDASPPEEAKVLVKTHGGIVSRVTGHSGILTHSQIQELEAVIALIILSSFLDSFKSC